MGALHIMLIIIGAHLVVLASLLVMTLVTQARRSGGRTLRLRGLWSDLLPTALSGQPTAINCIRLSLDSRAKWKAFHHYVDVQLRGQRGRSMLELRFLSRAVGLTERLQRELLQARNPLDRAAAGKTLGRLHERIAEETILELLNSKDPAVVLAAAYATASFKDPRQFLPVFRAMYDRTPITLYGAAELLSAFEEGICPVIHGILDGVVAQYQRVGGVCAASLVDPEKEVDRTDTPAQVVMTDLLAFYAYRPAAPTLQRLLALCEDEEVLIHLVKAIGMVGDASAVSGLTDLLTHPNWVIRSQSAQALAALGAVKAAPYIRALLDDGNLTARAYAQEALRSLETVKAVRGQKVTAALI